MTRESVKFDVECWDPYTETYSIIDSCPTEEYAKNRAKFLATQYGEVQITKRVTTVTEECVGKMVHNGEKE